ncbi:hypothetical protein [Flavobacterium fryxellicola]|uniref:hypothetical protein n=1 Tax=Flavobacterium fryxellicola TaxID=249352 RepID=UPI001114FAC4|nr:hypothetical protein [Flavobacterium fryxellicola]
MFTALVVVAFSRVAMVGTQEIKEKSSVVLSTVCDAIAYDSYYIWYGRGCSDEVSREKARAAKADCLVTPQPEPKKLSEA